LPGLAVGYASYRVLAVVTGLTMEMSVGLALGVLAATATMCVLSGFLAVTKLFAADPAELF